MLWPVWFCEDDGVVIKPASPIQRPDVFQYLDYREYLDHFVLYLKSHRQYSTREFAAKVGFSSPSYMRMIIDKKRNLTPEFAKKVGVCFDLSSIEQRFFERLVLFCQMKDPDAKSMAFEELNAFKKFRSIHTLTALEFEFYRTWWMPVLYEMVGFVDFVSDQEDILKELQISLAELEQGLLNLQQLGLVEHSRGRWKKTKLAVQTRHETANMNVRNFQKGMISKALKRLDEVEAAERDYQTLTMSLSDDEFKELKKLIYGFISKMNQKFSGSSNPKKVYQLNTQLFPLMDFNFKL